VEEAQEVGRGMGGWRRMGIEEEEEEEEEEDL
jgi:hypothetical protein